MPWAGAAVEGRMGGGEPAGASQVRHFAQLHEGALLLQFLAYRMSQVKCSWDNLGKERNQTEVIYADRHAAEHKV